MTGRSWLNRPEFLRRISAVAMKLYGVELSATLLASWTDAGLIPPAVRTDQSGRRPIYHYGVEHYRRALWLARLRRRGYRDRAAIMVELFICGQGITFEEARTDLLVEFRRSGRRLNAVVRSARADRLGPHPAGHRQALLNQIGPLADLLKPFDLGPDTYIEAVRAMRSRDNDPKAAGLVAIMQGMFPTVYEPREKERPVNDMERALFSADADTVAFSRCLTRLFRKHIKGRSRDWTAPLFLMFLYFVPGVKSFFGKPR